MKRLIFTILISSGITTNVMAQTDYPIASFEQGQLKLFVPYLELQNNGTTQSAYSVTLKETSNLNFALDTSAIQSLDMQEKIFTLRSINFINGGAIPLEHACSAQKGSNISPQFAWRNPPANTAKYAFIMDDETAPCGSGANACAHWAVYNIPFMISSLGKGQIAAYIGGITEGTSYDGTIGYAGPCPPNRHTYTFTLYALDETMPNIPSAVAMTRSQFVKTYQKQIVGSYTIQAVFDPPIPKEMSSPISNSEEIATPVSNSDEIPTPVSNSDEALIPVSNSEEISINSEDSDAIIAKAFSNHESNLQVYGEGIVTTLLSDDNSGDKHQRFIIKLSSNQTLLITHNIDLAPRINSLQKGDFVKFYGEYEWNDKGGVIHWTHRDPDGSHEAGWLEHQGIRYQ